MTNRTPIIFNILAILLLIALVSFAVRADDAPATPASGFLTWLLGGSESAETQYDRGLRYFHGVGDPENKETAVRWFRRAAERGHAGAQLAV